MAKKKDNNTLIYAGMGVGAYLMLKDGGAGGAGMIGLDSKNPVVSIDKAIETIYGWSLETSPSVIKESFKKGLEFSSKSTALFQAIINGISLNGGNWFMNIGGGHTASAAMSNILKSNKNNMLAKQEWVQANIPVDRYDPSTPNAKYILEDIKGYLIYMLKEARTAYTYYNTYKDTLYAKVAGYFNSAINALGDLLAALGTLAKGAWAIMKYLPWIVVGVGGIWAYNKFVKD